MGTRKILFRKTVFYVPKAARDGALSTVMAEGMEAGYVRLDTIVAALAEEEK